MISELNVEIFVIFARNLGECLFLFLSRRVYDQ